jgi:TANFOR domain-containing protein
MHIIKFLWRFSFVFLFAVLLTGMSKAQNRPLNLTVQVIPPYSPYFSDYIGAEGGFNSEYSDLITITVQNNDLNSSYQIKLIPEIKSNNDVSVSLPMNFVPARPINIGPGEVRVFNLSDLKAFNSNLSKNQINFSGISYRELAQTGVLPEGNYQVCVQAYDYNTSSPLSASNPLGCSSNFLLVHPDPPVITYPPNGATVTTGDPQNIQFSWTPPPGGSGSFEYDVRIIELNQYTQDPYFVMNNSNYAFYRELDLLAPGMLYDMSKPELEPGKTYAMRVIAEDPQGQVLIKNEGQSEIHVFSVAQDTTQYANDTVQEKEDDASEAFVCGGDCNFDVSGINQTPVDTFQVGDIINVGHFKVEITAVNWSGDMLNGEGKILPVDFIPVSVKAELSNVKINENGRVFSGKVQAKAKNSAYSNQSMVSDMGDRIDLPSTDQESLYDYLSDPNNLLANLQSDTEVELPVGIGTQGDYYQVAIVGLVLKPGKATFNTVSMIKAPEDQNKYLSLGAKDICINPSGLASSDSATLYLLDDVHIKFSDDVRMKLSKYEGASGTYASFGCNGFRRVFAEGDIRLSPEVIRYENADGSQNETDTVKLNFSTHFADWSDWLIAGNLFDQNRRYQFPEMEDYSFRIQNAVLDHSDLKNDPSLVFPDQYASTDRNATWKGLYIKTFNMMMPRFIDKNNDERIEITGTNILIDQHGVSTFLEANRLLTRNEGTIGSWEFSIDYLAMELVASHLDSAAMRGEILMPVSDSSFDYNAHMSYLNNNLDYDFNVISRGEINVPMWYAKMDLYESSALDLSIRNNNDVTIEATLNGKLSLENEIGVIDKVSIGGLEFERLILKNKPRYLRLDGAVALDASGSPSLLGFGANLGGDNGSGPDANFDIGLNEVSSTKTSLYLDMGLNFTSSGSPNSLAGNTRLNLEANYDATQLRWESANVSLDEIQLDANMGVMEVHGMINFFKNNPVYGKGFQGTLQAKFLETIGVDVNGLFGTVDDYRYFYVDGTAKWSSGGIGFFGLGLYGFGGGVAYNMKNTSLPTTDELNPSDNEVKSDYEPEEGSMGLKATVIGGLQGDPRPWNSDVTFEVGWNAYSGLTRLDIGGDSYFMQDIMDRTNPEFEGTLDMTYDFEQRIFSGSADKKIRIPADNPTITGDMPAEFHFEFQPNMGIKNWYVKLGEPSNRISTTVALTDNISFTNGSYFMVGSNIPRIPDPPAEITRELSIDPPETPNQLAITHGAGFAHGLMMDFGVDELDAKICYIDAGLLAGYDISVMNWSQEGILCNGRSEFGVNNWYARGQVYFLANARFYGKGRKGMTYFQTSLAALAEGGVPNPTGVKGKVKATFKVGPATWEPSKSFYLGEICNMSIPDTEPDVQNPYEDVTFIQRISPSQGEEDVSPSMIPEVEFNYAVDNTKDYRFADGQGGSVSVSYKIGYDFYIEELNGSQRVNLDASPSSDHKQLEVEMNEQLQSETYYEMVAEATLYQKSDNSWEEVYEDNRVVKEIKRAVFKTTTKEEIVDNDIEKMVPVKRERYFKKGDHSQGYLEFRSNMTGFFEQFSDKEIKVKIVSRESGEEHLLNTSIYSNRLTYSMPDLDPETIYTLKVLAVKPEESSSETNSMWNMNNGYSNSVFWGTTNNNQSVADNYNTNSNYSESDFELDNTAFAPVLYEYNFRTSMFNTMQEKINSLTDGEVSVYQQYVGGRSVKKLEIRIQGPERFEGYEDNYNNKLEFDDVNFKLQHNSGISNNFLPDWFINRVDYPVTNSQSWTTKAKYQVLRQSSPYQAFGQDPYRLKGYYGGWSLPSYFNGPLSDHDIEYGWEPDYSSSSNTSSYSDTYNNTSNVNFSNTYFSSTDYSYVGTSDEELTTVMAVQVELEKEIYQEFQDETVSSVEVAKYFMSNSPGYSSSNELEGADYVQMPYGNYKLRLQVTKESTHSKTIYFNF